MKKLSVEFENCYGIRKMKETLNFSEDNMVVIYAPNGTMKTSFANTFRDLCKNNEPKDRIYNLRPKCVLTDENGNPMDTNSILVVSPFDESMAAHEEQGKLMADPSLRERYVNLHKELDLEKEKLFSSVKETLGYGPRTKFDPITTLCEDYNKPVKGVFNLLKEILASLDNGVVNKFSISDINYGVLFDLKALAFYKKEDNSELIKQYSEKYDELLEKSRFLKKGIFDHRNFFNVTKNLKENGFFKASHQVIINSNEDDEELPPINNEDQLNQLLEAEKEKVLNDAEIKRIFEKISNEISNNKETKALDLFLQEKPEIISELTDVENFKKNVWIEAFRVHHSTLRSIIDKHESIVENLREITNIAKEQSTKWAMVLDVFKDRFHVPFRIEASNQEDVILKNELPLFEYVFEDDSNGNKSIAQNNLLEVLSTGEKRAYYLLDLIYKVEIKSDEKTETILVLDDIADSFDYKNKYAIVEYLSDIMCRTDNEGRKLFQIIILTHNFDFYRTIGSRLVKGRNCFISSETENGIKLTPSQYIKNYFSFVKDQTLKNNPTFILAAIPFVRNLIEYTYSEEDEEYEDYNLLTKLLHVKNDSHTYTIEDLKRIYNLHWLKGKWEYPDELDQCVTNLINLEASKISSDPNLYNKVNIENKLILSMSIRIKAEKIMINAIKNHIPDGESIVSSAQENKNQTKVLYDCYKENAALFPNNQSRALEKVVMMTPENIHINSFMYEPILDMQGLHLVKLYNEL
ncbi:hypothetical protein [Anaerosolibacter sp.]|uniref:hypothetical protein n=1 Tax=Anaerosolibacter sp. TaxID=1872527 RepID=UPI0039EF5F83